MTARTILAGLLALAAGSLFLPPRHANDAARAPAAPRARVGLVFDVGGRGDKSFNDAAYEGLRAARRTLGAHIE